MSNSIENNSVYNHLREWTDLVNQQKKEEKLTRKVMVEKFNKFSKLKRQREEALKKWENSGLLDGLKGHVKDNIAQLYESQASVILNKSHPIGISSRAIGEMPRTTIKYTVPIQSLHKKQSYFVRIKSFLISIWEKIFKKKKKKEENEFTFDLVSVQPLAAPSGLLFYLDTKEMEREDVYVSKVIIEKYKPIRRFPTRGGDIFMPTYSNI